MSHFTAFLSRTSPSSFPQLQQFLPCALALIKTKRTPLLIIPLDVRTIKKMVRVLPQLYILNSSSVPMLCFSLQQKSSTMPLYNIFRKIFIFIVNKAFSPIDTQLKGFQSKTDLNLLCVQLIYSVCVCVCVLNPDTWPTSAAMTEL